MSLVSSGTHAASLVPSSQAANTTPVLTTTKHIMHEEDVFVSIPLNATDAKEDELSYVVTGLPPGLRADSSTGLISGTVDDPGRFKVTVTINSDRNGTTSTVFDWFVEPKGVPAYTPPSAPLPTSPYLWQVESDTMAGATVDINHRIRQSYDYDELFGFNLNWFAFQEQLWSDGRVVSSNIITDTLKYFSGSRQRFPGGNNAVSWKWDATLGPIGDRSSHETYFGNGMRVPEFGLDEYIDFSAKVKAKPYYYVLNLTGLTPSDLDVVATSTELATSNGRLATYLDENLSAPYPIYQLGNELNRPRFGFSHQELITRSQASIDAVRSIQPDARFVNFLRDFDMRGVTWKSQMKDLYDGLPQVHDHSLFAYYDHALSPHYKQPSHERLYWMPYYLKNLQNNIDYFESSVRPGQTARIWITEHARRRLSINPDNPPASDDESPKLLSNLAASLSTSDFLVAIVQIPQVMGAMYHGSPGGPWRIFDDNVFDGDYQPLTVFWAMALLKQNTLTDVVATVNHSTNDSNYPGGYDTRAVAFYDESNDALKLWVVNRHNQTKPFRLSVDEWAGKPVTIEQAGIYGEAGVDTNDADYEGIINLAPTSLGTTNINADGSLMLSLPPSSISVYTLY